MYLHDNINMFVIAKMSDKYGQMFESLLCIWHFLRISNELKIKNKVTHKKSYVFTLEDGTISGRHIGCPYLHNRE